MVHPRDPNPSSSEWQTNAPVPEQAPPQAPPSSGWGSPSAAPPGGWSPPARPPSAYRLPAAAVRQAVAAGAVAVGAALVVAYAASVVVGVVATAVNGQSVASSLPGIVYVGAWLFGLGFGAPLVAQGGSSGGLLGSSSYSVTVFLPVPLVLAAAVTAAAVMTVRGQRRVPVTDWRPVLAAVGLAAAVPFGAGIVVALISRVSVTGGAADVFGGTSVGVAIFRGGLMPALVVALTVLAVRLTTGGVPLPEWVRRLEVGAAVRAVADYLVFTAGLMSVAVLIVGIVETRSSSPGSFFAVWVLTLPAFGVLVTELAAFAPFTVSGGGGGAFGSVTGSVGGSTSSSLYGGAAPSWAPVLLIVPLVGVLVAGLRFTLSRAPAPRPPWVAAGISAIVLVVALLVINVYLTVSFSVAGQASTFASGGLSAEFGVGGLGYLSAAVVGALIPLVGWLLAPPLYRSAPGVLRAALSVPFPARAALAALPPRPTGAAGPYTPGAPFPAAHVDDRPTGFGPVIVPDAPYRFPSTRPEDDSYPPRQEPITPEVAAPAPPGFLSPSTPVNSGSSVPAAFWTPPPAEVGQSVPPATAPAPTPEQAWARAPGTFPPVGSPPPQRPAPGGGVSRRTLGITGGISLVVIAAAVLSFLLAHRGGSTPVAQSVTPTVTVTASAANGASSSEPVPTPTFPSSTEPLPTPTFPTTSPGGVDLTAVASNPVTPQVAAMLDTYFGGINAHNGALAASVFDPSGSINPNDPAQVAKFNEQISTTRDDSAAITSIAGDPSGGFQVGVTFRSTQAGSYGPVAGETCTNWSINYEVTAVMKLVEALTAAHTAC